MKKLSCVLTVLVILATVLCGCNVQQYSFVYPDCDSYFVGNGSCENVTKLELNWCNGKVTVKCGNVDKVTFAEDCLKDLSDDYKLHYLVNNGKLTIQFVKSGKWNIDFIKNLTVTIPQNLVLSELDVNVVSSDVVVDAVDCTELEVESVSGDIFVSDVNCNELSVETVSGNFDVRNTVITELSAETVSGVVTVADVTANELSVETTSGDITVNNIVANGIDVETTSGDCTIVFANDVGFVCRYTSASGDFSCDLPCVVNNKTRTYKDGAVTIEVESVSGNLGISIAK